MGFFKNQNMESYYKYYFTMCFLKKKQKKLAML